MAISLHFQEAYEGISRTGVSIQLDKTGKIETAPAKTTDERVGAVTRNAALRWDPNLRLF